MLGTLQADGTTRRITPGSLMSTATRYPGYHFHFLHTALDDRSPLAYRGLMSTRTPRQRFGHARTPGSRPTDSRHEKH
jgi:hypothetical protein